ncbi:MAG: LppX_LprAFG lipoprotein [Dehalococcoidia bacterium]
MSRILLLIAALVTLGSLAACGGDDDDGGGDGGGGTIEETSTPEETPQEFLQSSADALEEVDSFHFVLEHENGGTEIVLDLEMTRAEGDVITPDRLKADVEADGPAGLDVNVQVIAIGEDFFFENPFGGGFVDADFSIQDILDPTRGAVALLRSAPADSEHDGSEEIDGVQTRKVRATIDSGEFETLIPSADAGLPVEVIVWIGVDDKLPYRIQIVGPLNDSEPDDIERTIEISDYNNPDVVIEPPE